MSNTEQRLDRLEQEIASPRFLENKGLGNEVRYYVFDYPAADELAVRARTAAILKKNAGGGAPFRIAAFDLYDLIMDLLNEKGLLEKCFEMEKTKGLPFVGHAIGSALRFSGDNSPVIRRIQENTPDGAVVFLSGVGKCYPILRSHKILNDLHQVMNKAPVVLFYPGRYDGQELVLFSEAAAKDDNYYRAFKIVD
ncbi:DUF1788 domain-containing protein [Cloacibacillus evryensis]|uniref:DUF1788 domain-containing protein n=1 Tax=Cloacibacillus evryensis TaxID=508460 RepID=UPI0004AE439F|nr:DUF1788 domain-containing protein [Cloacibacillus evryensis]